MILLILVLLGRSCQAYDVPMVKVMEDGYQEPDNEPYEQYVPIPPNWIGTDVSICFWLHPYRYLSSNSILSLSPSSIERAMISFILIEGKLVAKLSSCIFSTNIKPKIREWTHSCFSVSDNNTRAYFNGRLIPYQGCNINPVFQNLNATCVKIGGDQQTATPLSGKAADIRIYWRTLSQIEMANISTVSNYPSDYENIPSLNDPNPDPNTSPRENTYVEISSISREDLLAPSIPYMLIYISERDNYANAQLVCKIRQSLLPDINVHGNQTIIQLIYKFSLRTGISITSFWLATNSSTCFTGYYYLMKIIQSPELCNNTMTNYFCITKNKTPFKLIGLGDIIKLYPVPYEIGVFESKTNYKLYLQNEKSYIKDVSIDQIIYYALISKTSKLIGRHKWYEAENNINVKEITLTGCKENEFTCSNGNCIDIGSACDFHKDCIDTSDERYCGVGLSPSELYDARLPPSPFTEETTKLVLKFKILRITRVSIEDSTMDMFVIIKISWTDPRLQFKFLQQNRSMSIDEKCAAQYWQPDLIVIGAISSDEGKLSFRVNSGNMTATAVKKGFNKFVESYEAKLFSGEDVLLANRKWVSLSIMCNIDLFHFPFDKQTCSFSLVLINEFISNVEWNTDDKSITLDNSISLALFDILGFNFQHAEPNKIQINLKISRKYGGYIFNTFLPCVVLEVIGLMTHLLPVNDYSDRVTVTLSCLIVMATLFTQVSATLPRSAEPKLIDIWMFVHMVVLLLVFVVHVIVIYLHDAKRNANEEKKYSTNERKAKKYQRWSKEKATLKIEESDSPPKSAWLARDSLEHKASCLNGAAKTANRVGFIVCIVCYGSFLVLFYVLA